jgi:hypothetical protein
MRDRTKVIIGFGSIWGLFAFGALLYGSFTLGANVTLPEVVALALYGLTILPSCIIAIWYRRLVAYWLIALSPVVAFGFVYQLIAQNTSETASGQMASRIAFFVIIAGIPALIGALLLTAEPRNG